MSNAKNSVAETTATTGGAGVGQVITLTGAASNNNPTFAQAYGGAQDDIPVSVQAGNDWQTCRCDFNGTTGLTVVSIQSQFKGGVYDDASPTGITLSGTPVAQVSMNAASLVDSFGGTFQNFVGFDEWITNTNTNPMIDFSEGNLHIASNTAVGAITLSSPAGVFLQGTLRINNPNTITLIIVPNTIYWANGGPPTWTTNGHADVISVITDGYDYWLDVIQDYAPQPVITEWLDPTLGENITATGVVWSDPENVYASDGVYSSVVSAPSGSTDIIRATGFATSGIPDTATIIAIEVAFERYANASLQMYTQSVRLWNTTAVIGDEKSIGRSYPDGEGSKSYESFGDVAADDWNAGLTGSDVNKSTFGFQIKSALLDVTSGFIDHMRMRIKWIPTEWP